MNYYKSYFGILTILLLLFSCSKEEEKIVAPTLTVQTSPYCIPLPTYFFTLVDEMNHSPLLDSTLTGVSGSGDSHYYNMIMTPNNDGLNDFLSIEFNTPTLPRF